MGWDIIFRVRFATPETPAQRFLRIYEAVRERPSFSPASFSVCSDAAMIRRLARLGDDRSAQGPVTHESVNALLRQYSSEPDIAITGRWRVVGERSGIATVGDVTISALGAKLRDQWRVPADVLWDIGDSRRYTADGKDEYPNVAQVMEDLPLLVELGAESIWGVDSSSTLSPGHLFAVFHRDPNAFHDDGADPPFPDQPIDDGMVRIALAAESGQPMHERVLDTEAGPIIYHEDLGNGGDLRIFYAGLRGVLQADAEGVD